MNIVLLSGGSGKRLWPLSNNIRSKQFIKIFKNQNGCYESMLQRVYNQILKADSNAVITIATSKEQVSIINRQLGSNIKICVEPCRRDTFPAIVLAAEYLFEIAKLPKEEIITICPVDPYVTDDYFKALKKLEKVAEKSSANIILMGIVPVYPSEKYGYILPQDNKDIAWVKEFKEKPNEIEAEEYIAKGALWNGGISAFRLGYILKKAHELIQYNDYSDLLNKYQLLEKKSFDYAVLEKEKKIEVMRFTGEWKDLGTWNTLTESMDNYCVGDAVIDNTCENVHVINEMDVPVLCMGLKDIVVSASPDGILVSEKEQSCNIKPFVDSFKQQNRFAEKSWGTFRILDAGQESLTIKVTLDSGDRMNYHSHERRDEIWNIISGNGIVFIDGIKQHVKIGDVIKIPAGCKHIIIAENDMQIIEVQLGKDISINDKRKHKLLI